MIYYVYKIISPRDLEYLDEFTTYREAKLFTRALRKEMTPKDGFTVRMIFATGKAQAEQLLKEPREARPLGEDA